MKKMIAVILIALCIPWSCALGQGTTPIQLSLWSPVQAFPPEWNVTGFRFSGFFSRNQHMYGLDLGIFNKAEAASGGLQLGLWNYVTEAPFIFGTSGGYTPMMDAYKMKADTPFTGIQLGILNNYADDMRGLQVSFLNTAVKLHGIQVAPLFNDCCGGGGLQMAVLANSAHDDFAGVQVAGLMNTCSKGMRGVQIALINNAQTLRGVQIGLFNVVEAGPLTFFPIINAGF